MLYVRLTTLALIAFISLSTRAVALGQTPKPCASLDQCAEVGDVSRLKQMLQQAGGVDRLNDFKLTALFTAAQYDQLDAARLLISNGANVNHARRDGATPLMMAVLAQDLQLVTDLITAGADVNASDENGNTALMYGTVFDLKQTTAIFRYLAAHGANVNAVAKDGWTPLIWSIRSNSVENVECLLSLGANVNARDNKGLTALDHVADIWEISPNNAARKLQRQMRKVLIAAGASH